jgi:4'-phosphopantetheinyl transferase EntD
MSIPPASSFRSDASFYDLNFKQINLSESHGLLSHPEAFGLQQLKTTSKRSTDFLEDRVCFINVAKVHGYSLTCLKVQDSKIPAWPVTLIGSISYRLQCTFPAT